MLTIKGTIDRFEQEKAVIIIDNNQQIIWPKNKLPMDCLAGDSITLTIKTDEKASTENEKNAKQILNDILTNAQ